MCLAAVCVRVCVQGERKALVTLNTVDGEWAEQTGFPSTKAGLHTVGPVHRPRISGSVRVLEPQREADKHSASRTDGEW